MTICVIIATADRPRALEAMLRNLAACELPPGKIPVLVADNGTDPRTGRVCARGWPELEVRHLPVSRRGKTVAQNEAVEASDAELLVFTDDDVEFDANWLLELRRAAVEWPEQRLFGGRVLPKWPSGVPARLDGSRYVGPLYTLLDQGDGERLIRGFVPFGPNMAVRRSVFEHGMRFDEEIGPGSRNGVPLGDEAGIARQLHDAGEHGVYVPGSLVYHRVRSEQLSLEWQLRRGVRYGRMLAYFADSQRGSGVPRVFGVPRWLFRAAAASTLACAGQALLRRPSAAFDHLMDVAVALGRGQQARRSDTDPPPR